MICYKVQPFVIVYRGNLFRPSNQLLVKSDSHFSYSYQNTTVLFELYCGDLISVITVITSLGRPNMVFCLCPIVLKNKIKLFALWTWNLLAAGQPIY